MNQFQITSPIQTQVSIPTAVTDNDPYKRLNTPQKIKNYYNQNGYVVVRNAVHVDQCDKVVQVFEREVKPYKGHIYRQASGSLEKHIFTAGNHMLNSILNVQSMNPTHFKAFRKSGIEVLTTVVVQSALNNIFGEQPKLVQSMFFDGNPKTWAHQDTYYLDSENFNMAGVWFAMEDIAPDAGRFYIYPKSHKIDLSKNGGDFDIAFNHDRYKELVINIIKEKNLTLVAPALEKGDVLIWHAKTLHGSLPTIDLNKSRKSFTGHFIPQSERLLQYQSRIKTVHLQTKNGMQVNFPKDLNRFKNRVIFSLERHFPSTFAEIKRQLIKHLTK